MKLWQRNLLVFPLVLLVRAPLLGSLRMLHWCANQTEHWTFLAAYEVARLPALRRSGE